MSVYFALNVAPLGAAYIEKMGQKELYVGPYVVNRVRMLVVVMVMIDREEMVVVARRW